MNPRDYPWTRQVRSPLDDVQLRPLDPRCKVVQFQAPLAEHEYPILADFLRARPDVPLRVYGDYDQQFGNLEFLRFFPDISGFQADLFELTEWDGLKHLPKSLTSLALGNTRKRLSLSFLRRFPELTDLHLEGHTKDIETISSLSRLQRVSLRSITLPDLSILLPLRALHTLEIRLGGTANLGFLPHIGELRYLELWMVKGLADLMPIAELRSLQFLFLQALKNIVALPDFGALTRLRRVRIETMKGLRDLSPIATAPSLEELVVVDMGHLTADALRPFVGHPRLRSALIALGSNRKNEAARALLPLPTVDRPFDFA